MSNVKEVGYGANRLQIYKFDISQMAKHCTCAIIAKRATGKSFLTREIMYIKKHISAAIVISRTEKLNSFYSDFVPDSFIYDQYEPSILNKIYARQIQIKDDNERRIKEGKKVKDNSILLVMDDCMSDKGWVKEKEIMELFFNGRHFGISYLLLMQYSVSIPPELRSNFDYVFLLAEDIITNRKRLYDHYAGMFPSFGIFCDVFSALTENYGMMVINNRVQSKTLKDKVFWFKAKSSLPTFRIGSKKYKEYHEKTYDPKWNKKVPIFDPMALISKKRNSISLIVEKVRN
jgi:hypothetical protein